MCYLHRKEARQEVDWSQTGVLLEYISRHLRPAGEDLVWRATLQSVLCSVR